MVSLLFAGITRPLLKRTVPKLLTQVFAPASKWPVIDRNRGRLHSGMVAGFKSELPAG
jgi:hypothetical protein